ncbi:MAG: hypothetical protein KDK39_08845 [Leptospiraceae bacterium]|nr:hypothetical protein [Leptospiraceae bacterium]
MGNWIAKIGAFAAAAGVISLVLSFTSYELRILLWIDTWGTTIGYIIRGALVIGGGALYFLGNMLAPDEES